MIDDIRGQTGKTERLETRSKPVREPKAHVIEFDSVDTIEKMSRICREKYCNARHKAEKDKYGNLLRALNRRVHILHDEILKSLSD